MAELCPQTDAKGKAPGRLESGRRTLAVTGRSEQREPRSGALRSSTPCDHANRISRHSSRSPMRGSRITSAARTCRAPAVLERD